MRGARAPAFVLSLLGLVLAGDVRAQSTVSIATGFTPDPLRIEGRAQGAEPLEAHAPGCRGFAGTAPNHVIELSTRFGFLRFFATSPEGAGLTLALHTPDGRWLCGGRPLLGAPREEGALEPGRYEVWVGAAQPGADIAYELHVTEFRSVTPATGRAVVAATTTGGADIGLGLDADEGRHGDRRLRRGFLPDPRTDEGRAGGPIDVASLGGGCRGHVEAAPNHVVDLRDPLDYFRIYVARSEGPTSLIIRTPSGGFLCSAPDGAMPRIERDAWAAGRYRVWVGSRAANATPEYVIGYTETRPSE